jgi:hypothetical protein
MNRASLLAQRVPTFKDRCAPAGFPEGAFTKSLSLRDVNGRCTGVRCPNQKAGCFLRFCNTSKLWTP